MKKEGLKIIYYHTISDTMLDYFPNQTTQSIDTFKKQINYLNNKYNIISLDEAIYKFENNEKFSKDLVITTDDGFKENYTVIAPVLSDLNLSFTALLCNDLIDNKSLMWRNILFFIKNKVSVNEINRIILRICSLYQISLPLIGEDLMGWSLRTWSYRQKDTLACFFWESVFDFTLDEYLQEKKPYLTSNQIKELLGGGFSIGSHSRSHPYFKGLNDEEIKKETIDAALELERNFDTNINSFSFPFERPKDSDYLLNTEKILKKKFKVILGTKDSGLNHKKGTDSWERLSMEFSYYYSLVNFHLSSIKHRVYKK